ncbi:MAG: hypothetical protein U0P45_02215 [Acidimicrobiales bacterium]
MESGTRRGQAAMAAPVLVGLFVAVVLVATSCGLAVTTMPSSTTRVGGAKPSPASMGIDEGLGTVPDGSSTTVAKETTSTSSTTTPTVLLPNGHDLMAPDPDILTSNDAIDPADLTAGCRSFYTVWRYVRYVVARLDTDTSGREGYANTLTRLADDFDDAARYFTGADQASAQGVASRLRAAAGRAGASGSDSAAFQIFTSSLAQEREAISALVLAAGKACPVLLAR